jgi:hypothetical protein
MFTPLIAALVLAYATPARADWDPSFFNRAPAPGDLVLPMPCGAAITFRPVGVPETPGPLDDRPILLGDSHAQQGYNEFQRADNLSAPFSGPDGTRIYYIGKYDVTVDQFAAVRGEPCPTPTADGTQPITGITWLEAQGFASDLSEWFLAHDADQLPKRGGEYAFARLPTEAEWEYAARGGSRVSSEEALAPLPPMPEGLARYVQAGTQSAGHAQPVGLLLPNPLGLYDMLGNVDQMMMEPYRLNRVGRSHGQAGGFVARGGNFGTSPERIRTALRIEIRPYNPTTKEATRLPTLGFRVVLSAPTIGSLQEAQDAQAAFDRLRRAHEAAANDPRALIAALRDSTTEQKLREGLDRLAAQLDSDDRARADAARIALGAQLEAATVLAHFTWSDEQFAKLQEALATTYFSTGPYASAAQAQIARDSAARRRAEQGASVDGYLRLLRQIATGEAAGDVGPQIEVLRQELRDRGEVQLIAFLPVIAKHADALIAGQLVQAAQVKADILAVPRVRPR